MEQRVVSFAGFWHPFFSCSFIVSARDFNEFSDLISPEGLQFDLNCPGKEKVTRIGSRSPSNAQTHPMGRFS
jgi:hypothetical protein